MTAASPAAPASAARPAYRSLEARFADLADLEDAQALLGWDEAVMMPGGGGPARGRLLATLAGLAHEKLVDPELLDWAATAAAESLAPPQQTNLAEMRRRIADAHALPAELVRARQLAATRCEQAWRAARPSSDWRGVLPLFEDLLARVRETAACYASRDGGTAYDALLARHQPGITAAEVDAIFASLQVLLPDLVARVSREQPPPYALPAGFPVERQRALGQQLMQVLGFDFARGRLDVSHHPFTGGIPDDTRITTRYADDSFLPAQMAVVHETGHGIYQQNLPSAWRGQPLGDHAGMAVHESQSLLFEMQVGRSKPFLTHVAPLMQRELLGAVVGDRAWQADNLYREATRVRPGYIRVDADELTYPLHVILRFDLERKLIDGSLAPADLPDAWDAAMRAFLGLPTGNNHRDGCMQDVHWFAGIYGYFPCYTLGALIAAQLFAAIRRAIPDIESRIGRGDLAPLREWLRVNVHERGRALPLQPLLKDVTGEALDAGHFRDHLQRRYLRGAW